MDTTITQSVTTGAYTADKGIRGQQVRSTARREPSTPSKSVNIYAYRTTTTSFNTRTESASQYYFHIYSTSLPDADVGLALYLKRTPTAYEISALVFIDKYKAALRILR